MAKLMSIPRTVRLPWYTAQVTQVTRAEIAAGLNCKLEEAEDGYWDRDTRTIFLACDLPLARMRYTLYHEIGHMWNDAMDTFLDTWSISERKMGYIGEEGKQPCEKTPSTDSPTTTIT